MNKPEYLIVHHTGGINSDPLADTSHHTFEMVNEWHRKLWNFRSSLGYYIAYHYFIDKEGMVTQGRADTDDGAHCIGQNRQSIAIALAGNFDVTDPTENQVKSLTGLLKKLSKIYDIPQSNVVPHRKFSNKTCYGRRLSDSWAASLLSDGVEPPQKTPLSEYTTMELITELKKRLQAMRNR